MAMCGEDHDNVWDGDDMDDEPDADEIRRLVHDHVDAPVIDEFDGVLTPHLNRDGSPRLIGARA